MSSTTDDPVHPSAILLNVLIALLAPVFICGSGGDIALARMAAFETINGYRARNHADLIAVAQIVAFGLAALGSLSLSMADDLSLSMILRLRGNAVALNRSADQNRRALRESHASDQGPLETREPEYRQPPEPFLTPAAEQLLAAESAARLNNHPKSAATEPAAPAPDPADQTTWATETCRAASEINATLPNLPPAERWAASMQADILTSYSSELLPGTPPPPTPNIAHP
jgi:hypothetical protein